MGSTRGSCHMLLLTAGGHFMIYFIFTFAFVQTTAAHNNYIMWVCPHPIEFTPKGEGCPGPIFYFLFLRLTRSVEGRQPGITHNCHCSACSSDTRHSLSLRSRCVPCFWLAFSGFVSFVRTLKNKSWTPKQRRFI